MNVEPHTRQLCGIRWQGSSFGKPQVHGPPGTSHHACDQAHCVKVDFKTGRNSPTNTVRAREEQRARTLTPKM